MNLWCLNYQHHDDGAINEWYGNRKAADVRARELKRDEEVEQIYGVSRMHVPTDKKGLIDFLNSIA